MFDIMRPAQPQPGGYHPAPGVNIPDWCVCSKCRQMPMDIEKVCCEKENCMSLTPVCFYLFYYFHIEVKYLLVVLAGLGLIDNMSHCHK